MSSSHRFRFDVTWSPPAPVITVAVAARADDEHVLFRALLDSGADVSVLPPTVVEGLNLYATESRDLEAFDDGVQRRHAADLYEVHIALPGGVAQGNLQALGHEFVLGQEYIILGRDVLNMWRVTLDGPRLAGEISV